MDRDELIEELKKCPPGKIKVEMFFSDGEVFDGEISKIMTVPSGLVQVAVIE